jgi:hypothetical protein
MVQSFQPFFPQSLLSIALANSITTSLVNVAIGGANGTKIEDIIITSTDTIDHALTIGVNVGGTVANVANVNIPAGSGTAVGTPGVNLFANANFAWLPQDANGNKYLYLANAIVSLVMVSNSAIASGKALGISGSAAVF